MRIASGSKILSDVGAAPTTKARSQICGKIGRNHIFDRRALVGVPIKLGSERILGRVARTAMFEPLDQIGAAVPLRGHGRIGAEAMRREISAFQPMRLARISIGNGRRFGGGA